MDLIETIQYDEGEKINTLIKRNIISLEQVTSQVINLNIAKYIYYFAKYVKDAPVEKLEEVIIKIGRAYYIYAFAKDVKNAPVEKLAEAIIKKGNAGYIYRFAKDVKNAPVEKLIEALIKIGGAYYIYQLAWHFAINKKDAPIEKLADAIIETKNAEYIYYFAKYIEGAPVEKLIEALIKINDAEYIQAIIDDVKNLLIANITEEKIYKVEYIYSLIGPEEENTLLDKLKNIIIKTGNLSWLKEIEKIEEEINDIKFEKMLKLVKAGNEEALKERRDEFAKLFENNDSEKPKTRIRRKNNT